MAHLSGPTDTPDRGMAERNRHDVRVRYRAQFPLHAEVTEAVVRAGDWPTIRAARELRRRRIRAARSARAARA